MREDQDPQGRLTFEEWLTTVPGVITGDSLWKIRAYQLALFACDTGWVDVTTLIRDRRTISLGDQLYRALGSISANLAEGYSRGTGKDRARFYEYALGSARESRDWYFKARLLLGPDLTLQRLTLLTDIIRLLPTMIHNQRGRTIREPDTPYGDSASDASPGNSGR